MQDHDGTPVHKLHEERVVSLNLELANLAHGLRGPSSWFHSSACAMRATLRAPAQLRQTGLVQRIRTSRASSRWWPPAIHYPSPSHVLRHITRKRLVAQRERRGYHTARGYRCAR
jgi:hypothetical protein